MPNKIAIATMPGDTWNFQTWHRETGGGAGQASSNFTRAVEITLR